MKKLLIILFTFIIFTSYSQMFVFAEDAITSATNTTDLDAPVDSPIKGEAPPNAGEMRPDDSPRPHNPDGGKPVPEGDIGKPEMGNGGAKDTIGAIVPDDGVKETNIEINFTTERLPTALEHMGVGLAGVMMVLILIGVVVFVLNKVFKPA